MTTSTVQDVKDTFGGEEEVYLGEALPRGKYFLQVDEAAVKYAKADKFPYVELRLSVVDGEYAGRKFIDRMFLRVSKVGTNGTEPSAALGMTKALLRTVFGGDIPDEIVGISKYDSEPLAEAIAGVVVGAQFEAVVVIEKQNDADKEAGYPPKNRIQAQRPSAK